MSSSLLIKRSTMFVNKPSGIVLTGLPLAQAIANIGALKTIDTVNHTAMYNHSENDPDEGWNRTLIECDGIHNYEIGIFVVDLQEGRNSSIGYVNRYGYWKPAFYIPIGYSGLITATLTEDPPPQLIRFSFYEAGTVTYDYEKSYIRIVE